MSKPVPFYGVRPDPNGKGALIKDKTGRELLFTGPAGAAYVPGPPPPNTAPIPVEAPARTGYDPADVTAMRILAEERANRERQDARRAPMSLEQLARSKREGVAPHLGGVAPGSPEARIEEGRRVIDRPGDAAKTFARSAAAGALDTAALPVTLPARGLRAAGVPGLDTVADLQADEALQDVTWLVTGEEAGEYRKRVAKERADFPTVAAAGAETGAALAAAPLGGGITKSALRQHTAKGVAAAQAEREAFISAAREYGALRREIVETGAGDLARLEQLGAQLGAKRQSAEAFADYYEWETKSRLKPTDVMTRKELAAERDMWKGKRRLAPQEAERAADVEGSLELYQDERAAWREKRGLSVDSAGASGVRVASSAAQAPAGAQQAAYARGEKASDADIAGSAAIGAGIAGVTGAGARSATPYSTTPPEPRRGRGKP